MRWRVWGCGFRLGWSLGEDGLGSKGDGKKLCYISLTFRGKFNDSTSLVASSSSKETHLAPPSSSELSGDRL